MTPMKCKSFKATEMDYLDELVNKFMAEEGVAEVCYVTSGPVPHSIATAITIFYRVEEESEFSEDIELEE